MTSDLNPFEESLKATIRKETQYLEDKIKKIVEDEDVYITRNFDSHLNRIQNLETMMNGVDTRIDKLGEWMVKHFKKDEGNPNPNQKIKINKQVWEDLKYQIGYHVRCPPTNLFKLSVLVDLIKKVEPDWDPNKI